MKKWDASYTTNGFLAGLVAITCPCYWVSPTGAVLLGGIAGVIVIMAVDLLEYLRIDDPIGAVPVHGMCGIWGTLSLGFFACGQYGATGPLGPDNSAPLTGLFYGGGFQVLEGAIHRQRLRHAGDILRGDGAHARRQRDGYCFACRRTWKPTEWTCTSTAFRLTPNMSSRRWAPRVV